MKNYYKRAFLLLLTGIFFCFTPAAAQTLESDSLALVDLYNDCGGTNWVGFDNWLNGPISSWEAVTIDSALNRVSHVGFKNMDLTGSLPASLGNMDEMSGKIEFHDDKGLTGTFPSFIWNWTKIDRFQLKRSGITAIDTTGLSNLVNLTEFNTEANPITGMVPGVVFTLPAMEKVYVHDCNYDQLPPELTNITGLTRLYLNGNNLIEIPDMSGMSWGSGAKVRFHNNALTFEDLEANVALNSDPNVAEFRYSPQALVGTETYTYPAAGSAVSIPANVGGSDNVYTWIKDGIPVGSNPSYDIAAFDANTHSGTYYAVVQSNIVTGLDISTGETKLFASAAAQDSLALVDLYNDCGGTEWVGFDTWLNGPLNTWEQVTVDSASGRVTHVGFKTMDLTGTLPASLGDMTEMGGKIEFHDDKGLTGELPAFIWRWTNVERFQLKRSGITSVNTSGMENMVNLTEYNTEANPIAGMVPGVVFTLPAMQKVYVHDCDYDQLPPELTSISGLDRLYLNGNKLTSMPDMSAMTWGSGAKVRFHNNALDFEDLEPNIGLNSDPNVAEFRYSPQAMVGMEMYTYPNTGDSVSIAANVGGSANVYTWIKDGAQVGSDATYDIPSFDPATNSGTYSAVVQSTIVTGLDITTANTHLFASPLDQDSLALVDLYNTNGGTNWTGFDTWLNGPLNTWEQVTVDSATQRVTHVGFKTMDIVGTLPESLGNLTRMGGKIEFHDDSLMTGEFPAFIWRWVDVDRFQLKRSGITSMDLTGMENMVNLTEYNTEANPIGGSVPGVVFTLPAMVKVYVHDCEYDAVPAELTSISGLDRLYFNGNMISDLPDMSGMSWGPGAKVRVQNNALTFEDLESNVVLEADSNVAEFNFSPQAHVGMETLLDLATGDTLDLSIAVGGTANTYTWIRDGSPIGNDMLYNVDSVSVADAGFYQLLVQNTIVQGLDIFSEIYQVNVDGVTSINDPLYFGEIKVLGNPFDTNLRIETGRLVEELLILDIHGKKLISEDINADYMDLQLDELESGVYLVMLRSGNAFHSLKVVKR